MAYPPRAMRAERAAAYLAMSTTTFYQLVSEGVLPNAIKVRGMALWDRCELDAAFDNLKSENVNELEKAMGLRPTR